jgi:F-type H+-transporting ATPase subunit b
VNVTVTLFGQMITFAILVWFVNRYLWGPLTHMMQDRTRRIADGLAAAERGQQELARAQERADELLQQVKHEAAEIIAQTQKRAADIVEEAKAQAKIEGKRMIEAAKAEIDKEVNRIREQLRGEVVAIALAGASKILGREVDAEAHNDLLNEMLTELSAQRAV